MNPRITKLLANLALLSITFVWGATFTLTKEALQQIAPLPFLALRFLLAAIALSVLAAASPTARRSFHRHALQLGGLLGLLLFGAYVLQTIGLLYTTPATAGFLTGLSVVMVPLFAMPILHITPGRRTWAAVLLAALGLAFLCGPGLLHLAIGDVLVLLCAVFIALQIIVIDKSGRNTDALALATIEIWVLALSCTAASLWPGGTRWPAVHTWFQPSVAWAVILCAIPGTALAYWGQNIFQKFTSSAETAVIFAAEPVFAAGIAWMVLGEGLTVGMVTGCALILVGMILADPNLAQWRFRGRWRFRRTPP